MRLDLVEFPVLRRLTIELGYSNSGAAGLEAIGSDSDPPLRSDPALKVYFNKPLKQDL